MRKKQIVERLAEESHMPVHTAADLLDTILHDILKTMRAGRSLELPGIGGVKDPPPSPPAEVMATVPIPAVRRSRAKARR